MLRLFFYVVFLQISRSGKIATGNAQRGTEGKNKYKYKTKILICLNDKWIARGKNP
jgi:hypothetical protein